MTILHLLFVFSLTFKAYSFVHPIPFAKNVYIDSCKSLSCSSLHLLWTLVERHHNVQGSLPGMSILDHVHALGMRMTLNPAAACDPQAAATDSRCKLIKN